MARADLLKKLFRSFKGDDHTAFLEAAKEIIEEERKKHHVILATELTRLLENSGAAKGIDLKGSVEALPKDKDRGVPLLEIKRPDRYLEDLILSEEQRSLLLSVVDEFRQWDVLEANGLRPSHKLLFCGPPGCGKTATAEALSNELGVPLLYVRFDAVVSSLLGETAANLRKVFDYASRGIWVLLFDEFDAIGRSRDDATEHGELKRVVNAFLQMLDGFDCRTLVVAATNFEQSLDPALWRRFDEVVRFERPSRSQVTALLEKKLTGIAHPDIPADSVLNSLNGMTHADVERICLDVLRAVALRGEKAATRADFEQALKRQARRKQALAKSRPSGPPVVDEG